MLFATLNGTALELESTLPTVDTVPYVVMGGRVVVGVPPNAGWKLLVAVTVVERMSGMDESYSGVVARCKGVGIEVVEPIAVSVYVSICIYVPKALHAAAR